MISEDEGLVAKKLIRYELGVEGNWSGERF